jgi:hypothetical protein
LLQTSGLRARVARDGEEALLLVPEVHPDLILCDLQRTPVGGLRDDAGPALDRGGGVRGRPGPLAALLIVVVTLTVAVVPWVIWRLERLAGPALHAEPMLRPVAEAGRGHG